MQLNFDQDSLGTGPKGVEIGVKGYKGDPSSDDVYPCQIYLEIYEGKLQVHVWDGSSCDPVTVKIDPTA